MSQKRSKKISSYLGPFLKVLSNAPGELFPDLSRGSRLACEVPFDSGNRRPLWQRQHRRPSPLPEECSSNRFPIAGGAPGLLSDDAQGSSRRPSDSRRHSGSKRRQADPGFGTASLQPRTDDRLVRCDKCLESRSPECGLCSPRLQTPRKVCVPGTFKSKVELTLEILEEAFLLFPRGLTVVMDSWYACAPILNFIQEADWTFVAALK